MPLPPSGTFRLYPFAAPPLAAGRYTLTGDVSGLPGAVEQLPVTIDVVAPRYALPPDQILSTFPPAGASGAFTSRLPQIVIRRRTLPWERSPDLAPERTPTPWLALVLLAEGEGELLPDVPVEQCVTSGVSLGADRDVPKGACIEVPERVVRDVFPTRDDLSLLTHVREVDIVDTELAMGDDDGWMAVVLCNRLPQADTRYLACLVNLEGQYDALPSAASIQVEDDYDRSLVVADLRAAAVERLGTATTADVALMRLPGAAGSVGDATAAGEQGAQGPVVRSASGAAAPTGAGWASTTASGGVRAGAAHRAESGAHANLAKLALADGFRFPAGLLLERTFRFPVLAYWSFTCEARGDFQYLAERVTSRPLGYVPEPGVSETPDGDPPGAGAPAAGDLPAEPPSPRPLPLVAETGHVALDAVTRRGDAADAWFRGPLSPTPVERADTRPDGDERPPLAHHADQLRRVVPDGREDLGYASAFEIGRLLALSQPGVAAALGRWRAEAFGAARLRETARDAVADAPAELRELVARPDPLTADTTERLLAAGEGRRAVRALFQVLGEEPELLAPARPLADPALAAADIEAVIPGARDDVLLAGLGLEHALDGTEAADAPSLADALAEAPAATAGRRDVEGDLAALRHVLEAEAARLTDAAARVPDLGRNGLSDEERRRLR